MYVKAGSNAGMICNDHVLPLDIFYFYGLIRKNKLNNCVFHMQCIKFIHSLLSDSSERKEKHFNGFHKG